MVAGACQKACLCGAEVALRRGGQMLMPENVQLIKLIVLTDLSLLDAYYDCAHTSPMQKT